MRERGQGCLLKLKGCRFWYISYWSDGRQIRESTKTESKQEAEKFLRQRLADKDRGLRPAADFKRLKYEDIRQPLLDDYGIKGHKSLLDDGNGGTVSGMKHVDRFFHDMRVWKITTDVLRSFIKRRQSDGAEPGTINRNLALLRRMFFLARQEGKLDTVPYFPMLKENPARKGFVEEADFRRLLAALPAHLHLITLLAYTTGCRLGEAEKILWSQVDLASHIIRLEGEQAKNSEPRILPLTAELTMMLALVQPKTGHVFSAKNLRKAWMRACADVGLDGLLFHDLRRSAVRNMIAAGISEHVAMKISGHKTQSIFRRYNIVSTQDVVNAMNRVEARQIEVQPTKEFGENTGKILPAASS